MNGFGHRYVVDTHTLVQMGRFFPNGCERVVELGFRAEMWISYERSAIADLIRRRALRASPRALAQQAQTIEGDDDGRALVPSDGER